MTSLKNKMGLAIVSPVLGHSDCVQTHVANPSQTKIHKKYLGEPDDLHFIPHSPIIERQYLTEQEDGELKRICALALAQIPHSDDMTDDPLKYIAAQVQTTSQPEQKPKAIPEPLPVVPAIPVGAESATPSDGSKRDTMNRTDYSTPLTSAGITPGETTKRFSDAGKRASSSKGSSHLKHETAQRTKSRTASASHSMPRKSNDTGMRKSHEARKPSGDHRTLRIVQDTPRRSETNVRSVENVRSARCSQLELNKQLPPLPRSEIDTPNTSAMARMIKSLKKQKSQVIEGRSVSVSESPTSTLPPPTTRPQSARPRQKSMPSARAPIALPLTEPKRKFFKLPFFGNRKDGPQQGVVVT